MTQSRNVYMPKGLSLAEKIEYHSIPEPNSGCLLWLGDVTLKGYAVLGRSRSVARLILNLPPDLQALHKCDNPYCVNPGHLYAGTPSDNMRDVRKRDRLTKPCGNRKLTAQQVKEARVSALSSRIVAAKLGVSPSLIRKIRTGKLHQSREAHKFGFA